VGHVSRRHDSGGAKGEETWRAERQSRLMLVSRASALLASGGWKCPSFTRVVSVQLAVPTRILVTPSSLRVGAEEEAAAAPGGATAAEKLGG